MRKVKYLLLFVILIVLAGCSERELTFDRTYPNTANLDDLREKRKQEIQEEQKDIAAYIIKLNLAPRELLLMVKGEEEDTQGQGYIARPVQYCWAITQEECERMQPIHPYDDNLNTLDTLRIAAKQEFSLSNFLDNIPNLVPLPARIEAYIYDENKNLYLHETVDGTTPGSDFLFTAPDPGFYIFQFKVYYEGDVEGISYHPITIVVE